MSCVECPHCQQRARLADLRLPAPGSSTFYVRFAESYRLARTMASQPGRLLREANPGLTTERVKWYRRRCVELGLLARVRDTRPDAPVTESPTVHPDLTAALDAGAPLSVRLVQLTTPHATAAAAQSYLDELVAGGLMPAPV